MGNRCVEWPQEAGKTDRRKILVVSAGGFFSREAMDYAVHLAERLDYDLLALSVCAEPKGEASTMPARKSAEDFERLADRKGIRFEHAVGYGEAGAAVEKIDHEVKRVGLVITDAGINKESVAEVVTIPLFSVVSDSFNLEGEKDMAGNENGRGKKIAKTVVYGLLSAALYGAVFMNAGTIMQYFTRGGLYAALPIATVFVFSFVHGAFAGNLWSLMGIEAAKKDSLHQTPNVVVQKRKQQQKRSRTYAYVNPFHRIDR